MNTNDFCVALTDLGLHLTGTFQSELNKGNLTTKTAVFRALLKPVLDDINPNQIAGQVLPRGDESVDSVRPQNAIKKKTFVGRFGWCFRVRLVDVLHLLCHPTGIV